MTRRSLLLISAVGPLYWLLLFAAGWTLLRGHNEPGGGFIGGLLAVAASALAATVLGTEAARQRMPMAPVPLALGGVLLSLASGLPALLHDRPYLTHLWARLQLGPLDLPVSTVMLFDLGVFCAVWGALCGYVLALLPADDPAADRQ